RTRSGSSGTEIPPKSPAGCGTWRAAASRSLPSTARISAVPCAGSRNPGSSCATATAAPTTRTARALPGRRPADRPSTRTRSATLTLFLLQIATGICLALVYVPSADKAYDSLLYLNDVAPLGWFLRAVHFWGSNAMVAVMTLHMIKVFLFGAHKYPREMTWIAGVFLFLCTLGMAFTGQLLR